jgi:methionine salvage enolase-phosphatase E1
MNPIVEEKLRDFYTQLMRDDDVKFKLENAEKSRHHDNDESQIKKTMVDFLGLLGKRPSHEELNDFV